VEGVKPLNKGEPQPDPETDDRGTIQVRIHGTEERAAMLLKELVLADVEVIALSKVRSDLEDVYQSMGVDEVS
jgi:ABC-2 type transport system ATP-binding protein